MENLAHSGGEIYVSPTMPLPVIDVGLKRTTESVANTLTLITGAAGFTGKAVIPGPILSLIGDKVGSHWRKNPVWGVKVPVKTTGVTETAGSAAFTVYDPTNNLEVLFEGVASVGRFVARLTIDGASEIYGWIGGVSVASNVYTFTVFTGPALATQDWVGTLPAGGAVRKLEIFRNESSIAFTTGTVLTREIPWDFAVTEQKSIMDLLATMANGDYAVDYARGEFYYKKATTGTSDTVTYLTYSGDSLSIDEFPTAAAITDNFATPITTSIMAMTMVYDGTAWDMGRGDATNGLLVNLGTNNDVTVTGSVTANAGTNLNTSLLALESGGNLAAIAAGIATEGSALGSGVLLQGDDGTDRTNVLVDTDGHLQVDALTLPAITGTVTANAGTNLNTSLLALESGGNLAAAVTALQIMDDWDESDRAKVNLIVGQAGVAAGSGANGVTVPRVTVATDDPVSQYAASRYVTGIGHGVKTITTGGTDEALAGSTACKRVLIQAQTDNTNGVAVGASGVDATVATGTGVFLTAGQSIEMFIDNLADIYVDAITNGEGVRYTYWT